MSLLLRLCVASALCAAVAPSCPRRCLCFGATVRCMFLQLHEVPDVPRDTAVLDLRFNKVKKITRNAFQNLTKLNALLLNNNKVSEIEDGAFGGLQQLRYLYLYKNRIRSIGSSAFNGLHKLEQLYIHFNKLEKIGPDTFSDLPALERLFLHNNRLSRIPNGAFKELGSLKRLRLDANVLVCDCELAWLAELLRRLDATATCAAPATLRGRPVAALEDGEWHCGGPKLTEEPNDVEVTLGETAYFNCKADGDPKPEIVWLHNSNEILPGQKERYNILTDGTLIITEAEDLDQGIYECMAKSPVGEIKSRAAKMHYLNSEETDAEDLVTLLSGGLAFTERPSDVSVSVGEIVQLPCAASGRPSPSYAWTRDGDPLPVSARLRVSPEEGLTITGVQRGDAATYRCVASNGEDSIEARATLIVLAPPVFLERPRDQEAMEGGDVELLCQAQGFPAPRLTWTRDGNSIVFFNRMSLQKNASVLRINRVDKLDEGMYTCHAENEAGRRNSTALLMIRQRAPPSITRAPTNLTRAAGEDAELACRATGQPLPRLRWRKDGVLLASESAHHRVSTHGDLYLFVVAPDDAGLYQCVAENDVGAASVTVRLSVEGIARPGDRHATAALSTAQQEVERGLNRTLAVLFGAAPRPPAQLLHALRFPGEEVRDVARAAEVLERALEIVWDRVQSGVQFNLTAFHTLNVLSPGHLRVLATASGCLPPHAPANCADSRYRSLDGTCNNLGHPRWGAAGTTFLRLLPPEYENGFNTPIGWTSSRLYHGHPKPNARLVSREVVSTERVSRDVHFSHMLMQWGQFLDHDLDHSMTAVSRVSFQRGQDCATSCDFAPPCFPMMAPDGNGCMEFVRSGAACGSGLTSAFAGDLQPREQVNQLTSFLDASNVYGSSEAVARHLREPEGGLLRTGSSIGSGKPLLPFNDGQPVDCRRDPVQSSVDCFLAGDVRANEQLGLLAMHTLWVREHNRLAVELQRLNTHWNNDRLYHEARKIVGAMMQHISYAHWLPKILGEAGYAQLGPYEGYDADVNPSISNVFATAALRFGHTLINPELMRLNASFQPIPQGNLPLRKAFFAPFRLVEEGGVDPLLRGLIYASAKLRQPDQLLNSELTKHLFSPAPDLAALNVQRGRDHALPSYNAWRILCNRTVARSFRDLSQDIRDAALLTKLERLYGHPDNIDPWIGGISEDPVGAAKMGPTFLCLLVDQFKRLRAGDRFWYEKEGVFTTTQLAQIRRHSLSRVLCDSGDAITTMTRDAFIVPRRQSPPFLDCGAIPAIQLEPWAECCRECDVTHRAQNETAELVNKLEETVQRLSRKVRKLEALRKEACVDSEQNRREQGEHWQQDECTECHCESHQVTCYVGRCAEVTCTSGKC